MLIINHTAEMLKQGKIKMSDYNYPVVQLYRYKQVASLRGAERTGRMTVEFACSMRVEFIPAGCEVGVVKQIYFKVLKKNSCNVVGGVMGWPNLDHPLRLGEKV